MLCDRFFHSVRLSFFKSKASTPIHIVRLDERTLNIFILAGQNEQIELEITPDGSIEP
ncbi:MAG: DUF6888 family protein [Nostoc sp. ChiSLP01]